MYEYLAKLVGNSLSLSASADQRNTNKVAFRLFITIDVLDGSFLFQFLHNKVARNFILYDPLNLL